MRNRLGSGKIHDLQEVKRTVYEKDANEDMRHSKNLLRKELPKLKQYEGLSDDGDNIDNDDNNINNSITEELQENDSALESLLSNWIVALGDEGEAPLDEDEEVGMTECSDCEYNFSSEVLNMKFDDGRVYRDLNPLLCRQNVPNYPQEKLGGLRASKIMLHLLFNNIISLSGEEEEHYL